MKAFARDRPNILTPYQSSKAGLGREEVCWQAALRQERSKISIMLSHKLDEGDGVFDTLIFAFLVQDIR